MAQLRRYAFLLIAVVFHLVYIFSCFSIYFVSPIVHGMREHRVETQEAPAKRLVLFVGMSPHYAEIAAADHLQATAFAQTRHSSPSQTPTPMRLRQIPQSSSQISPKPLALSHPSSARKYSKVAHSVSPIPVYRPSRALVTSRSSQDCMKMYLR